jgi:glycerol-3-phosphate O-acyltransferase/dihydroxyacetone phosphate acyltransferase
LIALLLAQIAESDCEAFHKGLLDQPVNAWTSLAMVAAGLLIAYDVKRRHLRSPALVFAAAVAFAGIGSFLFHGFPSDWGRWVHDVSLLVVLGIVAGVQLGRAFGRGPVPAAWSAALTLLVTGVLLAIVPDATNVVVGVAVIAVVVAEIVGRRRRQAPLIGFWTILFVAIGVASFLLGRTDGPLCDPDSEIQLHGLWHILIAVVTMLWADRAFAAPDPRRSGWGRATISRFVVMLAQSASKALLRDVEVVGRDRLPADRPVLIVSNHFNGFVDPVLVIAALGRLPRFLAKGTLWNIPPAGAALSAIGVLPVHRPEDREGLDNSSTFSAAHEAFMCGDSVALFPEGTTSDRAQLDRVRTGAARIALGAAENGVSDLVIVAVGLAYEDRLGWRSRVLVEVGEPLDVSADVPQLIPLGAEISESDHDSVRALTTAVDERLRSVSPNYEDVAEREGLRLAAGIALRTTDDDPPFAAIESTARSRSETPPDQRRAILRALADYELALGFAGLTDRDVASGRPRGPLIRALIIGLLFLLALPVMVVAVLANVIPFALVRVASRRAEAVVTKGTVRLVVGLIVFPLTWIIIGGLLTGSLLGTLIIAILLALAGLFTIWFTERIRLTLGDVYASVRSSDRRSLLPELAEQRIQLVDLVNDR